MTEDEIKEHAIRYCHERGFQPIVYVLIPNHRRLAVIEPGGVVEVATCVMLKIGGSFVVKSVAVSRGVQPVA